MGPQGPFHAVTLQKYFMHMRVKKLPNRLSNPDALDRLVFFIIVKIVFKDTVARLKQSL